MNYASFYKSEDGEGVVKVSAEAHAEVSFGHVINATRGKHMDMKGAAEHDKRM